jgi:hypothetical protein
MVVVAEYFCTGENHDIVAFSITRLFVTGSVGFDVMVPVQTKVAWLGSEQLYHALE